MSKRRVASELMFGKSHGLRYPTNVTTVLTGTGTQTRGGVLIVVASNVATRCYLTVETATNKGVLVGTDAEQPVNP